MPSISIKKPTHPKTREELLVALDCAHSTLSRWRAEGMPLKKDGVTGEYNLSECQKWIAARKQLPVKPPGRPRLDGTPPTSTANNPDKVALVIEKLEAEVAKLRQEARGKSLKNDEYEGLLLPSDDVRQWIASRFLRIKNRLEQLPDELQLLAPASLRPQLRADLGNAIHDLLLEMSSWEVASQKTDMSEEV